jgi:hypothetical protein
VNLRLFGRFFSQPFGKNFLLNRFSSENTSAAVFQYIAFAPNLPESTRRHVTSRQFFLHYPMEFFRLAAATMMPQHNLASVSFQQIRYKTEYFVDFSSHGRQMQFLRLRVSRFQILAYRIFASPTCGFGNKGPEAPPQTPPKGQRPFGIPLFFLMGS